MSTSFLKLKRRKKVCLKWLCIFFKLRFDVSRIIHFLSITFHTFYFPRKVFMKPFGCYFMFNENFPHETSLEILFLFVQQVE